MENNSYMNLHLRYIVHIQRLDALFRAPPAIRPSSIAEVHFVGKEEVIERQAQPELLEEALSLARRSVCETRFFMLIESSDSPRNETHLG